MIQLANRMAGDVLDAIRHGWSLPEDVELLVFVHTSDEPALTLVFRWGRWFVVWDADTDTDVFDTEANALDAVVRGLVATYGHRS